MTDQPKPPQPTPEQQAPQPNEPPKPPTEEEKMQFFMAYSDQALRAFIGNGRAYIDKTKTRNANAKKLITPDGSPPKYTREDLLMSLDDLAFLLDFLTYIAVNVELLLNDNAPQQLPGKIESATSMLAAANPVMRVGVPQGLLIYKQMMEMLRRAQQANQPAAPAGEPEQKKAT